MKFPNRPVNSASDKFTQRKTNPRLDSEEEVGFD